MFSESEIRAALEFVLADDEPDTPAESRKIIIDEVIEKLNHNRNPT